MKTANTAGVAQKKKKVADKTTEQTAQLQDQEF